MTKHDVAKSVWHYGIMAMLCEFGISTKRFFTKGTKIIQIKAPQICKFVFIH
jgi:hypothetical protein